MKLKFITVNLLLLLLFILFNICYSQDETSSSSSENDNSFCIGRTERECVSSNACCVWCEGLLPNSTLSPTLTTAPPATPTTTTTPEPTGYCHYIQEITQCPSDMKFAVCSNYNITKCTCNFRNSAISIYNSSHSSLIVIIIASIVSIISIL